MDNHDTEVSYEFLAQLRDSLWFDDEGIAKIEKEESDRSSPVALIERVWMECASYQKAGIRNQYKGSYRGHEFIIGWEVIHEPVSSEAMFLSSLFGGSHARKVTRKMVFCIAGKPGGYATDGLRFTDEVDGPLSGALHALYALAETLYERAEVQRLMGADKSPNVCKGDTSFLVVDP